MYKKKTELDGMKFPVGFLQNNIDEFRKKHDLINYQKIMKTLVSQRITNSKHHVPYRQDNGFPYPLLIIEDEV